MENVEMKEVIKEEIKIEKKAPKVAKNNKADAGKVSFMESRNEIRKAASLPEAYSKEDIDSYR